MIRRSVVAMPLFAGLALALLLTPSGEAVSQSVRQVFVTNFPELQRVEGRVGIEGPVPLAASVKFEEITVPPVPREDTTRLVDAGVLAAEGFPNVVLSLHGVVKGHVGKPGTVGAILLPEERTIRQAFDEHGMLHFHLETAAGGVSARTPYFASDQPLYSLAFPRYRVLLYNTTDKTVSASLYAYLTN